ncbi:hypothetical protein LguiB_010556 [Lonicera macranthoides]
MSQNPPSETLQIHHLPQSNSIDALRWLPPRAALDRSIVLAVSDSSTSSTIQIHSINPSNSTILNLLSSWSSPSKISSLKVSHNLHKPYIAASTFAGSLHVLFQSDDDLLVEYFEKKGLHLGKVACIDLQEYGGGCVSVGEDGRVNLVSVGDSGLGFRQVFDSEGLVSYTATKWGSETEFATGGLGFGLQWWDIRKPGGPASQFKGNWAQRSSSGIIHSIDIHPSRKHTCLAGGSCGTVFAWDRRGQQPIILSGGGAPSSHLVAESEVWEVQWDNFIQGCVGQETECLILIVSDCSGDGRMLVLRHGVYSHIMVENCKTISFTKNSHGGLNRSCSNEFETGLFIMRMVS